MSIDISHKSSDVILNITNGNFRTLWNSLGLDVSPIGKIEPALLLDAIRDTAIELVMKKDSIRGDWLVKGITRDQVINYFMTLRKLAEAAITMKEDITWD